jgi:hypothetical protein
MNILSQGYEDNDRDFRLEQFEKDKNMLAFWLQKQEDAQRAVDVANTNIEYLTKLMAGKIGRTALRPEDETN